ncbi:unnamed protein product [Linum trigynum]|uniref:Uncharacterized protein n=1 Tax=Linum trigynum TaxID=586398 RepID=A0AAV2D5Q4_9ROSI
MALTATRLGALRAATSRTDQANPVPTKATDEGKFTDGKGCGNRLGWGVEGGGASKAEGKFNDAKDCWNRLDWGVEGGVIAGKAGEPNPNATNKGLRKSTGLLLSDG